jgi:hypothetical protein
VLVAAAVFHAWLGALLLAAVGFVVVVLRAPSPFVARTMLLSTMAWLPGAAVVLSHAVRWHQRLPVDRPTAPGYFLLGSLIAVFPVLMSFIDTLPGELPWTLECVRFVQVVAWVLGWVAALVLLVAST